MTNHLRTILVTGAGSGLGRGLSLALARQGHQLLATDLHLDAVRETAAMIVAEGGKAVASAISSATRVFIAVAIFFTAAPFPCPALACVRIRHCGSATDYPWRLIMPLPAM